ncbi:extracellular solute-binding protein [Sediminihabitans luteus]|uniref:extracellular solute-binding protein n=1 Tax=Sediminihabitans luteus TaxID=1138585 RepID=UPI0012FD34E9|nr:extracellular solute-binding protein [Sediminihabitans luteus]
MGLGLTACSSDDDAAGSGDKATDDAASIPDQLEGWEESAKGKTGQTVRVWLIQPGDSQKAANEYLKTEFEKEYPGNTLVIEEQQWQTYKDKYLSTLAGSDAPDVVEMGNTDTQAFTAIGALLDLTAQYEDLGGDDLLPAFTEIGSLDGHFYAPPYYSAARLAFYSPEAVPGDAPTTLDDYVAKGKELKTDDFSGIYLPGKDWYNVMTYVWAAGAEIATQDADNKWTGGFDTPEGIKGLTQAQDVLQNANSQKVAPADGDESKGTDTFCEGKIGYLAGAGWLGGVISDPAAGCPDGAGKDLKAFAIPGNEAGTAAPTFSGGSNLAVAKNSKNTDLAYGALKIIVGAEYQNMIAEKAMIPALQSSFSSLPDDEATQIGLEVVKTAKPVPASPKWSEVETKSYLKDAFTKLAQGGDPAEIAKTLDQQIADTLNS